MRCFTQRRDGYPKYCRKAAIVDDPGIRMDLQFGGWMVVVVAGFAAMADNEASVF